MGDTWWVITICPCVNIFSLMGGVTEADVVFPTDQGRCFVKFFALEWHLVEVAVAHLRSQCSMETILKNSQWQCSNLRPRGKNVWNYIISISGWRGISSTCSQLSTEFNHFYFRFCILLIGISVEKLFSTFNQSWSWKHQANSFIITFQTLFFSGHR